MMHLIVVDHYVQFGKAKKVYKNKRLNNKNFKS